MTNEEAREQLFSLAVTLGPVAGRAYADKYDELLTYLMRLLNNGKN